MSDKPFFQMGPEVKIVAAATAPTAVQVIGNGNQSLARYRVTTPESNEPVWVGIGRNAAEARDNAVIPTGGGASSANTRSMPAGWIEIIRGAPGAYFTAVTRQNTANVYISGGE